jgi:glycerol kinase
MAGVIESITFLIQANVELLLAQDPRLERIRLSGGLAKMDGLCRKLASLSGLAVERPVETEATARGIAWLAAGCPDDWEPVEPGVRFEPGTDAGLGSRYRRFLEALETRR